MKRILLLIFSISLFSLISSSTGQEAFKLGVADAQRVLEGYQKAVEANKLLEAAKQRLVDKLENLVEEIRTLEEKKTKTELFVPEAESADLAQQIRLKQDTYVRERNTGEEALFAKQQELMVPILKEIEELIIKIGEAEGYDLILNKTAVLYVNDKYDLTDKLIKLINAGTETEPETETAPE